MRKTDCFCNKQIEGIKIFAFYLPQFHQVEENDLWWGKGFTEWTAVKSAEPIWYGHKQPRVPLNNYYYDLSEKSTMKWQSNLMKEYGVDGLCIYHYWFKNGRRILEKPAENLLEWKDLDIPFCFCWANESWVRTWSNVSGGNAWAGKFDGEITNKTGELLQQSYGAEDEWEEHFEYLLPFFKDDRYLKIQNKPVFVIYKPLEIPCLCVMRDCWNEIARRNGFSGVYFINLIDEYDERREYENVVYAQRSPSGFCCFEKKDDCGVKRYSYDKTWKKILDNNDEKCLYTGFVAFDDTPRKGNKGTYFEGATPEKFSDYILKMMSKSAVEGKNLVFLNAWNEWGEGMYLEPDVSSGYKMLNAVKNAKEKYKSDTHIDLVFGRNGSIEQHIKEKRIDRNLNLLDRWLTLKENHRRLSDYLYTRNIKKIAVYGYGIMGKHFLNEVEGSEVEVVVIVDKNADEIESHYHIAKPSKISNDVDAVVVTAINYFDEIYEELKQMGINTQIINLEQVVMEMR